MSGFREMQDLLIDCEAESTFSSRWSFIDLYGRPHDEA